MNIDFGCIRSIFSSQEDLPAILTCVPEFETAPKDFLSRFPQRLCRKCQQQSRAVLTPKVPVLMVRFGIRRSAVAQGAAIYGLKISKSLHIHDSAVAKHNYGIETDGNQVRLVSKASSTAQ